METEVTAAKKGPQVGNKIEIVVGIQGILNAKEHAEIQFRKCRVDLRGVLEADQVV